MMESGSRRLRLLTYNMQVGIRSRSRREYFGHGWRHVLPPPHPTRHLEPLVHMISGNDIVAIQEADAGSFRTRSINLLHYLADRAGYSHWHIHNHRSLAPIARHGMGLLSQYKPADIDCRLMPGRIPGRGVAVYRFSGHGSETLTVVVTHLSLGERDRRRQLSFIQSLVEDDRHVVLMGDLNCEPDELHQHPLMRDRGFTRHPRITGTHPSWQPDRLIDHILVTPEIRIVAGGPIDFVWSDHLPLYMEIELPENVQLVT